MAHNPLNPAFQYDPLDLNDYKATRFVRVNAETRDGLLDCEIWHATAYTNVAAVTFRTDSLSDSQQIFLNGRLKSIDRTLWDFFAVARVLFPLQSFWIKPICTDNDNEAEQAHQVKLAPQVYYMASDLYVWLGPNDFYTSHAMDILSKEVWDSRLLVDDKSIDAVRFWVGLCEIMLSGYWERAETVLELALPSKVAIMQGEHLLSIEKLSIWSKNISDNLSRNHAELSRDLYQHFQLMLKRSGISALQVVRDSVQNCNKADVPAVADLPLSTEVSSKIWRMIATGPSTYCDNIKTRVFSLLGFTEHGIHLNIDQQLSPFELFLECILLHYDSGDVGSRVDQMARLLDMTAASILMYTKKPEASFRIPGTEQNGVASAENKTLHQRSSASKEDQELWRNTGFAGPEPDSGPYYATTGLADLHWINGTGGPDTLTIPEKCQLKIAMRAGSKNVFLLLGVHFSDDESGSRIKNSADMEAVIHSQDMSDEAFRTQTTIKCCSQLGIYETRYTPSKKTVYYALIDGSVYTDGEVEKRALHYFNGKLSKVDRKSMIWETPDIHSMTPLISPPGFPTENADIDCHVLDTTVGLKEETRIPWEESVELADHKSSVGKVAFSPDGKILASYSTDDTIRLRDTTTGLTRRILKGFRGNAKNLAFSADGDLLAHELLNGEIQIWRLATEQAYRNLTGLSKWGQVTAVAFSPDRKLVASSYINQAKVRLWNLEADNQPALLEDYGHFAAVTALAFAPDGRFLASGSVDKSLLVWNLETKTVYHRLMGHTGTIVSISFSPDGDSIVSASPDKTIRLWKMTSQDAVKIFRGHEDAVSSVSFSPDGTLILSGSDDGTARVWDIETGETLHILRGHRNAVKSIQFSPNGWLIASGSEDGSVRLWGLTKIEAPTMLNQIHFHGKQWASAITDLFKKAGSAGDIRGLMLEKGQSKGRHKKADDEEHELEEMPDRPARPSSEDLTQRRAYVRPED